MRLTIEQTALVVKLGRTGQTQTSIAGIIGCSQRAVSDILAKFEDTTELAGNALKANALKAVQNWSRAATIAAGKGNHIAVKELLEAAMPELRPAVGNGNSAQVVVMLGTSVQPLSPPAIANGLSALSPATFAPVLEAKVCEIAKDSVADQANRVR